MITLCEFCSRISADFPKGECFVCGGECKKIPSMVDKAVEILKKENVSSFSISTFIPKKWLAREESIFDLKTRNSGSIKNVLNRTISDEVASRSGLSYGREGDCRLSFDMRSGRVELEYLPLFIFGRYKKKMSGISQSRWPCPGCMGKGCEKCGGKGKLYHSIEEEIGVPVKKYASAGNYVLHASGREDVDATNSGGRPFVLELKNSKNRNPDLGKAEEEINRGERISVHGLKKVPQTFVEVVTESHFDKDYTAETEFGRELSEKDVEKINLLSGVTLKQRTPRRVSHRRADKVRSRKVISAVVSEFSGNRALIKIRAEAGTYIKEFISGDENRTVPSVSSELKTDARVASLDVSGIEDGYLDLLL